MENIDKNKIGLVFLCKVNFIAKNYFKVETADGKIGIIYINEISDYFVNDINSIIKIDDIIYLTLKEVKDNGVLVFSFKENKTHFLRTPFEFKFSEQDPNENKFQNLFNFTNEEIKKWKK
ncbi:MAG: hypothetical protein HDR43_02095 [Mycoplasma sp.]|nr:hypothetical protein [Mycoplasma sp.]